MTVIDPGGLDRYGWTQDWADRWAAAAAPVGDGAVPGRIVRHDGVAVMVALPDGVAQLPMRATAGVPVVGDWVVVDAERTVAAIVPRATLLRRRDADKGADQALAANVDVVGVVCGLDRPVKLGRIHRSVMLADDAGALPVIVLTKADRIDDQASVTATVEQVQAANPDVEVVVVDSKTGRGLDRVHELVDGRTIVLLGESGAGKSTLTNALAGHEVAATARVRRGDAKGRHTTTAREMHPLPGGAVVVDSPGIRSVGVWVDDEVLASAFPEIEELSARCRFSDCAHDTEPGCAVQAAIDAGELAPERLDAWRALAAEAATPDYGPRRGRP